MGTGPTTVKPPRGQTRRHGDVDIIVELDRTVGLFDFVGIRLELEEALERRVDLVEYDAIKPAIRERVLAGEVLIDGRLERQARRLVGDRLQ